MAGGWQPKATVGPKTNPPTGGSGSRPPQPKKIVVEIVNAKEMTYETQRR